MGNVFGAHPLRLSCLAAVLTLAACVGTAPAPRAPLQQQNPLPPALPDTTGWGIHVLALERAGAGATWVGTYGHGIFVLRARSREWEQLPLGDSTGISWGFVNSIAFERDSSVVWYGTVGNGFGRTTDGGRTWRNWTFAQLGPEWQYVAHDGIVTRRDTVYIATADGLRISGDGGSTWRCIQERERVRGGAAPRDDGCTERILGLPTKYLLSLDVTSRGIIYVGHLRGLSISRDGGRTWTDVQTEGLAGERVRGVRSPPDSLRVQEQQQRQQQQQQQQQQMIEGLPFDTAVWAITENRVFVDSVRQGQFKVAEVRVPGFATLPGSPRALTASRGGLPPIIATSYGLLARANEGPYRFYHIGAADRYRPAGDIWTALWWGPPLFPIGGSAAGINRVLAGELPVAGIFDSLPPAMPEAARHLWFQRPIASAEGNPHIDATYRYGSTMGGNFQQHQGVEFNNPAGTPVHAIGDGVVVFAGAAEAGANTVAIRHDRQWEGQHIFSTYYHNSALTVQAGQRVRAGDVIARVGNTGRATNDHLHLEVHVAPQTDSSRIVDPAVRFPPHTTNPQLWLQPLPGTGVVAGRVMDAAGQPVPGARLYGLVLPYPVETPFSFAETYADRGTPSYQEHFAVGDVPEGTYTIGVEIGGRRVWRRVRVQPGMVTFVEFRP
jgi:murein DD-endopeptidase MepM/ murein hydrolase activator NlpD